MICNKHGIQSSYILDLWGSFPMCELSRNKGCTKVLETVSSWFIFIKGHAIIAQVFLVIPTNFQPQSAPEKLDSPMNPWQFRVPITCTLLIMSISLYFLLLPAKHFRFVGMQETRSMRRMKMSVSHILHYTDVLLPRPALGSE